MSQQSVAIQKEQPEDSRGGDLPPVPDIAPGADWSTLMRRVRAIVPEAFGGRGQVLNLMEGTWGHPGHGKLSISPCDGTVLGTLPMIDQETARRAVAFAASEHETWSRVDLDERRRRVADCVQQLREHRELLALLLVWEIGKPYRQALTSVDRCISGVEWYLDHIERMMEGRTPLGLISNIASWNYPLSVLVHSVLAQVLAGNAVIAKTPSDGGLYALTLSFGIARRCGLPVSLVSGSGGQLSDALVRNDVIACLAFVGGKTNGRDIAASLYDHNKRYMLEMEGINAYGIWDFSDWEGLAGQIKKGFEYGKQRCTAYARYVIQRELFPQFLQAYLPLLDALQVGHPLLTADGQQAPPALDFGPLINGKTVEDLRVMYSEAIGKGAISVYEGSLSESLFFPEQDTSAYIAPAALLNVPRNCALYHAEPFGPIDTIVIVDRIEELIAEMNVSNGSLVASIACDDARVAGRIGAELRSFKVGVNRVRSRGDREEPFGGIGESWKGCFVGGEYLVQAVTQGPEGERLYGNFPDYTLLPDSR
jgi:acyl-CoA reductase-like NAD-dependent aldehyde dehydrogenase